MGRSLGDEAQSLRDCVVVSLTVSPVKNAEGQLLEHRMIARDITEQKRSQEQIATLAREAEHRSKNLLATVQATVRLFSPKHPTASMRDAFSRLPMSTH